jgi:hypothetical protein
VHTNPKPGKVGKPSPANLAHQKLNKASCPATHNSHHAGQLRRDNCGMNIRIRFKYPRKPIRFIKGKDLAPHPQNWRTHPPAQLDALKGMLSEVGFCDVVKGIELADGRVMLIDGHARAEVLPDQELPVLILDLDETEAKKMLVSFDPVGDLAGADTKLLDALLQEVQTESAGLQAMLDELALKHGLAEELQDEPDEEPGGEQAIDEKFQILIICETEQQQAEWLAKAQAAGLQVRSLIA